MSLSAEPRELILIARRLGLDKAALAIELSMGLAPPGATRGVVHTIVDLSERSKALAQKHGFTDAALEDHETLYHEVMFCHSMVRATVKVVDGQLQTSSAASSWRTYARERLPKFSKRCAAASFDELYLIALELWSDETSHAAIGLVGLIGAWSDFLLQMEVGGICLGAARDKLASCLTALGPVKTYSRRPPLDAGLHRATQAAERFWCEHRQLPASKTFNTETTKASLFVLWYLDLMKDAAGLNSSQCQTLLGV